VEGAFKRQLSATDGTSEKPRRAKWDTRSTLREQFTFRYTFKIVKRILSVLLLVVTATALGSAVETSFHRVRVPNLKGKHIKAVLTFSDQHEAVEVRPAKGDLVTIPYGQIEKCSYQYTSELTIALTKAKSHWLEIDYHDRDASKQFVLLMDKREYLRILAALKTHTGIDAEVLGNADKRHEKGWHTR